LSAEADGTQANGTRRRVEAHRTARGRGERFANYRLMIAGMFRDYGMEHRAAILGSAGAVLVALPLFLIGFPLRMVIE